MDLLETILRAAQAENQLQKFRKADIDAQALKILTDEDLVILGIDDEDMRRNILDKADKITISSERKVNTEVDDAYCRIILLHTISQLKMHNANLFCIANRPDVINCNIMLDDEVVSLLETIQDFKEDLQKLKLKIKPKPENRFFSRMGFLCFTTLTLFVCGNLFMFRKMFLR